MTNKNPTENMRNVLGWPENKRIFSKFDLKEDFLHSELPPSSRNCTLLRSVLVLLQHKECCRRTKSFVGTLRRILSSLFGDRKAADVVVFLDSTSIKSITEEDHLESSSFVLDTPLEAGVRLKLSKCSLGMRQEEALRD